MSEEHVKPWGNYLYYIIIGIVSVVSIAIFPMMGSDFGLEINFPTTIGGWIVYVGSTLSTAIVNMFIFYGFMSQAKLNVKDNERYKEGQEILIRLELAKGHNTTVIPRSPKKWTNREWAKKGTTLFLGSIFSCFAFTNAILTFNVVTLITYTFTVLFAICFGIFQMKTAEDYWTDEFYRYAKYEEEVKLIQDDQHRQQNLS